MKQEKKISQLLINLKILNQSIPAVELPFAIYLLSTAATGYTLFPFWAEKSKERRADKNACNFLSLEEKIQTMKVLKIKAKERENFSRTQRWLDYCEVNYCEDGLLK